MSFSRLLELRAHGVSFLEMEGKRWFLLTSRLTSPSCRSFRCLNELVQHLFVAFLSGMPIWPSAKRQSDSLTPSVNSFVSPLSQNREFWRAPGAWHRALQSLGYARRAIILAPITAKKPEKSWFVRYSSARARLLTILCASP